MTCEYVSEELISLRDHFVRAHLPENFYYNPVKTLLNALSFLAQEFTGVGSMVQAGLQLETMLPRAEQLIWSAPMKQAAKGIHRHFYPDKQLTCKAMERPGRWTLLNWECLAQMVMFLDPATLDSFKKRFKGDRDAKFLPGVHPSGAGLSNCADDPGPLKGKKKGKEDSDATVKKGTSTTSQADGHNSQKSRKEDSDALGEKGTSTASSSVATTSDSQGSSSAAALSGDRGISTVMSQKGATADPESQVPGKSSQAAAIDSGKPGIATQETQNVQAQPQAQNGDALGKDLKKLDLSERQEEVIEADEEEIDDDKLLGSSSDQVMFFDSHFHLDRLAKSVDKRKRTMTFSSELVFSNVLEASEKLLRRNVSDLGTLLHAIAIFCDPLVHRQLVSKEKLLCQIQKDPRLFLAFGLHPKKVVWQMDGYNLRQDTLENLSKLLMSDKVVAFGEVGLDYTVPEDQLPGQEEGLIQIIKYVRPILVERQLPIVVHCRQGIYPRTKRDATTRMIGILEHELGLRHPIQVHFFMGFMSDLKAWMQFSNVVFSVPARSEYSDAAIPSLMSIPRDRLLLETDAPYGDKRKLGNSYDILAHGAALASILKVSPQELMHITTRNALKFFNVSRFPGTCVFQEDASSS